MRLGSIRISFARDIMRRGNSEIGLEIDVRNWGLRACAKFLCDPVRRLEGNFCVRQAVRSKSPHFSAVS